MIAYQDLRVRIDLKKNLFSKFFAQRRPTCSGGPIEVDKDLFKAINEENPHTKLFERLK